LRAFVLIGQLECELLTFPSLCHEGDCGLGILGVDSHNRHARDLDSSQLLFFQCVDGDDQGFVTNLKAEDLLLAPQPLIRNGGISDSYLPRIAEVFFVGRAPSPPSNIEDQCIGMQRLPFLPRQEC
jgi:hypothetical protein